MMDKIALFAFNGEMTCFVHVLLNALDMSAKGHEVAVVVEGAATALIPRLAEPVNPLNDLYHQVKDAGLIDAVCRACSAKMKVTGAIEAQGLPFADEMKGHPSMARYREAGFKIITF
jgi:hypothetical protein